MKNHFEERLSMAISKRVRAVGSISNELLKKSREAALAAVQIFNNPSITFKSEIFIVLMVISWTYLMHAHFRKIGIDYRYFKTGAKRKKYEKTIDYFKNKIAWNDLNKVDMKILNKINLMEI